MTDVEWVVVLLSTDSCDQDPNARCVMEAIGPFTHHSEAMEAASWMLPGLLPHVVPIRRVDTL